MEGRATSMTMTMTSVWERGSVCTAKFQNRQRPVTSHLPPLQMAEFIVVTLCLFPYCTFSVWKDDYFCFQLISLWIKRKHLGTCCQSPDPELGTASDAIITCSFCRSWRRLVRITACERLWPETGLWFTGCKTDTNSPCIPLSPVWTSRLHPSRRGVYFPNPGGQVVTTPGTSCSRSFLWVEVLGPISSTAIF